MSKPDSRHRGIWEPPDLSHHVALVTGASYGVGRGIAQVLGECGATVFVTGRSTRRRGEARWPIEETAELVTSAGGKGIPLVVDHARDEQVERLFNRIGRAAGRLDLLVNNVWQWGPQEGYGAPTWEQPVARWDAMVGLGVRAHFVAARHALSLMVSAGRGLIVETQERPGDETHFCGNVVVDVAAAAQQRLVQYVAQEARDKGVAALLVYLGWVRSVNMMGAHEKLGMTESEFIRLTQSPHLIGRAVAMLLADPGVVDKSGQAVYAGDLAREYGFTDVDGRIPRYEGGE